MHIKKGVFQTPLPALTVRVNVAQFRRAKNETANCSTGQADHSNLSEISCSDASSLLPKDSTVWVNEQYCEHCAPAKLFPE